ncbi:MAG: rod shape-determining protein MreD [Actinomycetes bacterium]|nr:rod shape-determining protein MreD [Actinomycetes bacterium]
MNRFGAAALALLAAVVAQLMLAPNIAIGTVSPDFLLLVVVTMAFVGGSNEGAAIGFIAGLAWDFIGSGAVGPMALTMTVTGFTAGLLQEHIFAGSWLLPVSLVALAALLSETIYALILLALGDGSSFGAALIQHILPTALYTGLVGIVVFVPLSRYLRRDKQLTTFRHMA